ncbi:MAG: fatty acid desaturase [Gammaproteobacteria bacterium]|nr:fatty acid desaturase [Gammaproteobacteria bacterium]
MSELVLDPHKSAQSTKEAISALCVRSDAKGAARLATHVAVLALTGCIVYVSIGSLWLVPAMLLHGVVIGTLFAIVHEGVHYTAFQSRRINEVAAWVAGCIIGLNSTFYRQFHYEHHRFTQDPERDPELGTAPPTTFRDYALRLSAIPYWRTRLTQMVAVALGKFEAYQFVPRGKRDGVRRSIIVTFAIYGAVLVGSLLFNSALALWLWFAPLLLGQPILRFWLLCEHTGCSNEPDGFINTRSTLTIWPVRFLMWNMPFHAEHHLHPQIPFHALPAAHEKIGKNFTHVANGYIETNLKLLAAMRS